MRSSAAGYSLLEMLVVLAILGLIAALAVPPIGASIDRMRLSDDTRILSDALRQMREVALNEQRDTNLTIAANTVRASTGERWTLGGGTTVEFVAPEGAPKTFAFHADGTANGGAFRIHRGKAKADVRVDDITGTVEIAR